MNHSEQHSESGPPVLDACARRPRPALRMWGIALSCLLVAGTAGPGLFEDGIFPFDGAAHAGSGAFFLAMAQELPRFVHAPIEWMWDYWDRCPGPSVRRHPPVFGIAEAAVFSVTGISVLGAKLTILLFALSFAAGFYVMCARFFEDELVALLSTLVVLASPQVSLLTRSIWLDVPAMSFLMWAFVFYQGSFAGTRGRASAIAAVMAATLSLYTYQLTVYCLAAMALHAVLSWLRGQYSGRRLMLAGGVFIVLMFPLALFTMRYGGDNLQGAMGVLREEWLQFAPVKDKASAWYWTYYFVVLLKDYPIQGAGLVLWFAHWLRRPRCTGQRWESLLALCVAVSFIGFSINPSKGARYAVYIAVPATPLAVLGFQATLAAVLPRRPAVVRALLAAGTLVGAIAVGVAFLQNDATMLGMDRVAQAVLAERPQARVLYCGRLDSAFLFFLRQSDPSRQTSTFLAESELHDQRNLEAILRDRAIDIVIAEPGNQSKLTKRQRDAIAQMEALATQRSDIRKLGTFEVTYGSRAPLRVFSIQVFRIQHASLAERVSGVKERL